MDLNRIALLGNVSQEPEQKTLANGASVTKLNVATSYAWKDSKSGDKKEKVNFHTVIAWNGLGKTMNSYLKKGDKVYLEGRVDNRSYEDKAGITRYVTEIIAQRLIMLGGKSKKDAAGAADESMEEVAIEDNPF